MALLPPINTTDILQACEKAEVEIKKELKKCINFLGFRRSILKNRLWWIGNIKEMAKISDDRKFYCLHLDHDDICAIGKFLKTEDKETNGS